MYMIEFPCVLKWFCLSGVDQWSVVLVGLVFDTNSGFPVNGKSEKQKLASFNYFQNYNKLTCGCSIDSQNSIPVISAADNSSFVMMVIHPVSWQMLGEQAWPYWLSHAAAMCCSECSRLTCIRAVSACE